MPLGGSSHTFEFTKLAIELAAKGHRVTLVTPTLDLKHTADAIARLEREALPDDFRLVSSDALASTRGISKGLKKRNGGGLIRTLLRFRHLPASLNRKCGDLLLNSTLMEEWRGHDALVAFRITSEYDSCTCLLAHALGLPRVVFHGRVMTEQLPITVPQFGTGLKQSDLKTLRGMALNAFAFAMNQLMWAAFALPEFCVLRGLRARVGLPLGGARSRSCAALLDVLSSDFAFEPDHRVGPPRVLVGSLSPQAPRPLNATSAPPSLAEFVESPESLANGLVTVSFGSMTTFLHTMTKDDYAALALAFADLAPARVLWGLRGDALPEGLVLEDLPIGNNTLVVPWVPNNDVLGHPATRLFVAHGGIKSIYESLHHGKPLVGIPFMAEQLYNLRRMEARGLGLLVRQAPALRKEGEVLTREPLAALLRQALERRDLSQATAEAGQSMRRAYSRRRPVDRAVDEIELALLRADAVRQTADG